MTHDVISRPDRLAHFDVTTAHMLISLDASVFGLSQVHRGLCGHRGEGDRGRNPTVSDWNETYEVQPFCIDGNKESMISYWRQGQPVESLKSETWPSQPVESFKSVAWQDQQLESLKRCPALHHFL